MSEITIRPATLDDCAAISDIYNHYVLHDTCTYQEETETVEERRAWFAAHGAQHPVIVAEREGEVVGWGSLSPFHKRSAYRFTVENSVYLKPDVRGHGIGSLLLHELITRAETLGHRSIMALISAEQTASIKLHEKFGFVEVAHLKEVGFKTNQWLDVVYMQLMLAQAGE